MKKNNTKIIISVFCFILLGLTACTSNPKGIEGKYVSIYDESTYLIFNKDGSLISSLWTTIENGESIPQDCFRYSIDENNIITAIDTTEYEGQNELNKYEIGIMYKDYICIKWNGTLSNEYEDTSLTNTLGDLNLTYNLKEDNTYEYTVTSEGEVVHTENGTYSINDNEVICTNEDKQVTTFINIEDNIYCIEYVKE